MVAIPLDDRAAALIKAQEDPVWFVENTIGSDPWGKQCEILESVRDNPRTSVRSCHGAGKSWIASRVALWFLHAFPDSIVITTAPTFRQVRNILWREIGAAHASSKVPLGSECLTVEMKIAPKWYAFGFSTDDPDAAQGIHAEHVLVIVDEASGVHRDIRTALDGCLSSNKARELTIGNPTDPTSEFFRDCTLPGNAKFHISAFDTPNFTKTRVSLRDIQKGTWKKKVDKHIEKHGSLPNPKLVTPSWVADKHQRWGEESPLWKSRVMGEFPDSAEDTLIPLSWLERAHEKWLNEDPSGEDPRILGVDVARFGSDETCIYLREGPFAQCVDTFRKASTMETAGRVKNAISECDADSTHVDVIGVGAGVFDRLHEQDVQVFEYNAAARSSDREKFGNLRAESFWSLRERAERGDLALDPEDEELTAQLSAIRYKVDSSGRLMLEKKEDMKKRGLPSPDRADAVAIAFANLQADEFVFI